MGVHRDGGFRDYVAVPASAIIGVPADMPFGFAAAQAPEAFDLIEKEPQRTLKVQLDFS
jgi:NADPH:quinone reductase-like Zn-dependent oxidoreductase